MLGHTWYRLNRISLDAAPPQAAAAADWNLRPRLSSAVSILFVLNRVGASQLASDRAKLATCPHSTPSLNG